MKEGGLGEKLRTARLLFLWVSHCHVRVLLDFRHAIIRIITAPDTQRNTVGQVALKNEALPFPLYLTKYSDLGFKLTEQPTN